MRYDSKEVDREIRFKAPEISGLIRTLATSMPVSDLKPAKMSTAVREKVNRFRRESLYP